MSEGVHNLFHFNIILTTTRNKQSKISGPNTRSKTNMETTHNCKKTQINLKLSQMHWLIGRKSKLTIENKLLLYKVILKPIWTYGIQLWGCTKPSNTKIIQRVQSKILRLAFNAPWYVSNKTLRESSSIPFVADEIKRLTNKYLQSLSGHTNKQVSQLQIPPPRSEED